VPSPLGSSSTSTARGHWTRQRYRSGTKARTGCLARAGTKRREDLAVGVGYLHRKPLCHHARWQHRPRTRIQNSAVEILLQLNLAVASLAEEELTGWKIDDGYIARIIVIESGSCEQPKHPRVAFYWRPYTILYVLAGCTDQQIRAVRPADPQAGKFGALLNPHLACTLWPELIGGHHRRRPACRHSSHRRGVRRGKRHTWAPRIGAHHVRLEPFRFHRRIEVALCLRVLEG